MKLWVPASMTSPEGFGQAQCLDALLAAARHFHHGELAGERMAGDG